MQKIFNRMDTSVTAILREIGKMADGKKMKAFVVGGFVRDVILKRSNCDIDVVIEGDAVDFAKSVADAKKLPLKSYKRFGTATVGNWGGAHVDFVSARAETYPYPGALPVVRKAGLRDDLYRRDFTINALAVRINQEGFGTAVDYYGGLMDLRKGIIRIFHDESFCDDPTRILRAVRFEQRFGFRLASRTRNCLRNAIEGRFDRTVSASRYFQEFARGLSERCPSKYLRRLKMLKALNFLELKKMPQQQILNRLDTRVNNNAGLQANHKLVYLSALFSETVPCDVQEIARKFQWPRVERKAVLDHLHALREFRQLAKQGVTSQAVKNFLASQPGQINSFIRLVSSSKIWQMVNSDQ